MKVKEDYIYNFMFEKGKNLDEREIDKCGDYSLIEETKKPLDYYSFKSYYIKKETNYGPCILMKLGVLNPHQDSFTQSFFLEYQKPFEEIMKNIFKMVIRKEDDKIQGYYGERDPGLYYLEQSDNVLILPTKEEYKSESVGFIRFKDSEFNLKLAKDIINFFSGKDTEILGVKK